jgi:hypothetical protein
MFQPDLFTKDTVAEGATLAADIVTLRVEQGAQACTCGWLRPANDADLDLPAVLERLARISTRPRYTFMVLNLIARAAGHSNSAGPYVQENGRAIPVRDWLSDALIPMAQRDVRRRAVVDQVRCDLEHKGMLPSDPAAAEQCIAARGSRAPSAFGADQCQPCGLRPCPGRSHLPPLSGLPRRSFQSRRPARGRLYDRSSRSVRPGERHCRLARDLTSAFRRRRPSTGSEAPRQGVSRTPAARCGGCRPRTR